MEITEIRIKLMEDPDDRLQAFCSITFDDCFVIRDLKIIEGANGPFVAMPSRKLTSHCSECGGKNHLRSLFCNQCGTRLSDRAVRDQEGRAKLYADIAHPINSQCREMIQSRVIADYRGEIERAKQPGYMSRYDEDYEEREGQTLEHAGQSAAAFSHTLGRHAEPAELQPRAPHKRPAQHPAGHGRGEDFGAGIFD